MTFNRAASNWMNAVNSPRQEDTLSYNCNHTANRKMDVIRSRLFFAVIVLIQLFCSLNRTGLALQQGSIMGRVFVIDADGSRSYIPGVLLQLRRESGTLAATTDETGRFIFNLLAPGKYSLSAEVTGMKRSEQLVEVRAGATLAIEIRMEVAEVKEEISVSAEAPLIQLTEPSSGAEITNSTLSNAPNINERFETALPLVPGVVRGPDGLINIKGSRASQGGMLVNSSNVTDPVTGSTGFSLPIDVVSSVQVLANHYVAKNIYQLRSPVRSLARSCFNPAGAKTFPAQNKYRQD